jgi:hypothetical protein
MKVYKDLEQGTEEWLKVRLGKITGTRLKDVFKSNNLTLVDELISEMLTGELPEIEFKSAAMERGNELEPEAINEYMTETFNYVQSVGFVESEEFKNVGFSPDGLIANKEGKYIGAVEVKCPSSKKHIEYIRGNKIPNQYKYQIYSYFLNCLDLDYVDFISYDPRVKSKSLFIKRVFRGQIAEDLEEVKKGLIKFNIKLDAYLEQVNNYTYEI